MKIIILLTIFFTILSPIYGEKYYRLEYTTVQGDNLETLIQKFYSSKTPIEIKEKSIEKTKKYNFEITDWSSLPTRVKLGFYIPINHGNNKAIKDYIKFIKESVVIEGQ